MKPLYSTLILAVGLAGCADHFDTTEYNSVVEMPASIAQYEYLKDYAPLKEYIDRNAHPGFLLGTGVSVSDYLKRGAVYTLTNSNFDQVTAGNAMKYASVVDDKGNMNFGNVIDFVDAATSNGLEVYGHTLCWHAQQNVTWLNSLIADKEIPFDPDAAREITDYKLDYSTLDEYNMWGQFAEATVSINKEEGCLELVNPTAVNFWEVQFFTGDNFTLKKGRDYTLRIDAVATGDGVFQGNIGSWGNNSGIRLSFSTEREVLECNFNSAADEDETSHILTQCGDFVGTVKIYSVEVVHSESAPATYMESLLTNGDADNGETENLVSRFPGDADINAPVVDDPEGTGKVFKSEIGANPANDWDSQFFIVFNQALKTGDKIHVSFRYRCSDTRDIGTQAHGNPGDYHHWAFIGTLNATPEWKELDWSGAITADMEGGNGCKSIAFNLSPTSVPAAATFYIDDVVAEIERSGNTIPLTPAEKEEILTNEMERWVKGMMMATEGKVKAWDVVNEAISGGPWGQRYDLQHGSEGNTTDFFWQDYLGDNFVRVPVKFARKYFEEAGGNPSDLKLFINDYNLESDWDNNQKLKSLIEWIEQWESDGETVIDGIGTQMHVSCYEDAATQESKQNHVVEMYKLMAKTDKLCRVTELDMGFVDANGNDVPTADLTFEQAKKMSDYYKFIIEKYFEIIPLPQQYGICQWAQTDSPDNSGWRPGQPIGLWDSNLSRKPTYAGFADGLAGK